MNLIKGVIVTFQTITSFLFICLHFNTPREIENERSREEKQTRGKTVKYSKGT